METYGINVGIDNIRDYIMDRIDTTNPVETEKVGRYLKHIEMFRRMERKVKKDGEQSTTINASQSFDKAHPLLNEMNKINSSIISIEKTINFIKVKDEKPKSLI